MTNYNSSPQNSGHSISSTGPSVQWSSSGNGGRGEYVTKNVGGGGKGNTTGQHYTGK